VHVVSTIALHHEHDPGSNERATERRLRSLIEASPVAIIELDRAGLVREWNAAAEQLLGWPAEQVLHRPVPRRILGGGPDLPRLLSRFETGVALPVLQLRCRRKDGRMVDVEVSAAATRDVDGQIHGVMGLLVDMTERKRLERALLHQTQYDSLTGLPNRRLLTERLTAALDAAGPDGGHTGLLLIDLNRFKEVNDTLGHASGDQLLAQIGPRLITAALRQDDTVARLSGDEFAVLLPRLAGIEDAMAVAHRVLTSLHTPFTVDGTVVDLAASIGVALAPDHTCDANELLQHADVAMYEAKENAAGVVLFAPADDPTPTRFGLLGELRRALDGDELVVYYQPKIDMGTGGLHGVEALVRWLHPERGVIPPDEFIPIAEKTGVIHRLTTRVLDLALAQTRVWADAGLHVPVAVNVSARCLQDPDLPARVLAALARHDVPVSLLRLEITESAIMADPSRALTILRALADAGIGLSLDDFGTGYSSMSYLRKLPVDELKVDRSFVQDLTGERADAVLVRSAVDLGHNLGLSVVAEGVEDVPTLTALHRLGCDVAQGYHFARPMPPEEFSAWHDAYLAGGAAR
jgi:diguanylate cyclase (GGDEF)-like protein/PAS domain S-box-containing protein